MKLPFAILLPFALSACLATPTPATEFDGYSHNLRLIYPKMSKEDLTFRTSEAHVTEFRTIHACAKQLKGYAGFVVRHSPIYEVHAYFTGDAFGKLNRCTQNPFYKTLEVKHSLADLEVGLIKANEILEAASLPFYAGIEAYGRSGLGKPEEGGQIIIVVDSQYLLQAKSLLALLSLNIPIYIKEPENADFEEVLTSGK